MKKYKYLFWDIDGTVLNFLAAEKQSIITLFEKYGFGCCSDEMLKTYSQININYWKALERKEIEKNKMLVARFADFFAMYNLDISKAESFNADYQLTLGDTIVFNDNADEILKDEKKNYCLVAITNGTLKAQQKKLTKSGLVDIFDHIYISENVGYEKPSVEYFDYVLKDMQINNRKEVLIIGDSLTSDILGGNNSNIDTCWYNPNNEIINNKANPTYIINNLEEIKALI